MEIGQTVVVIDTAGGTGVASGSGLSDAINGFLLDIALNFHASAPATTDTTISQEGPTGTMLALANTATDGLYAPRVKPVDNAGAAITNAFGLYPLNGRVQVALAQCDPLAAALTATIRYLRL